MSWLRGYQSSKLPEEDSREERRKKLEAERLHRAEQRAQHKKSLEAATTARKEANEALNDLLALDPSIFEGIESSGDTTESVLQDIEEILAESSEPSSPVMADFETENGQDEAKALQEALRNLQNYEWNQEDLLF